MQFITLPEQFLSMLRALIFGAACAAAYDCVRALRYLIIPQGKGEITLANVFDIIYGILLGCGYSVFLFIANNGKNRWYLLASVIAGFALYRLSAGKIIDFVLKKIADIMRKILIFMFRTAVYPVRRFVKLIKGAQAGFAARRKYKKEEKEKVRRSKTSRTGRER